MRSKKGQEDIGGFMLGFILVVLLIIFAFVMSAIGAFDPIYNYHVEGVTRFHTCDTTLLNLLNSNVPEQDYTFASAISENKPVTDEAKILLDHVYNPEELTVELVVSESCCLNKDTCCSQIIPMRDGTSQGVCLVAQ